IAAERGANAGIGLIGGEIVERDIASARGAKPIARLELCAELDQRLTRGIDRGAERLAAAGVRGNQGDDAFGHARLSVQGGGKASARATTRVMCEASPQEIVIVAGPTASGKSALALALAEEFGGTIINADSQQVYRDLAILSARPGAAEMAR